MRQQCEAPPRHYPTGGWGYRWFGEPDGGYGKRQPGGWGYNILEFIEQPALRRLGQGVTDINARQPLLRQVAETLPAVFNCPSKRPLRGYPVAQRHVTLANNLFGCRFDNECRVGRNDYRANAGNRTATDQQGPDLFANPDTYGWNPVDAGLFYVQTGVTFRRSAVRVGHVTDGTARTLLLGEKYLDPAHYEDGEDSADDQSVFIGHDRDNAGYTGDSRTDVYEPHADMEGAQGKEYDYAFGGAHATGFNMAYCDGSVHFMTYEVDSDIWWLAGGRSDEE
ncbi:MAG TPA: DUF1559 domain-containing protein [Lacipirellulaceae bacterium]|nr:DUF1559 domain-containing protein [Lacipirellulaceae bacterium]